MKVALAGGTLAEISSCDSLLSLQLRATQAAGWGGETTTRDRGITAVATMRCQQEDGVKISVRQQ
jgi:hypothetical protein